MSYNKGTKNKPNLLQVSVFAGVTAAMLVGGVIPTLSSLDAYADTVVPTKAKDQDTCKAAAKLAKKYTAPQTFSAERKDETINLSTKFDISSIKDGFVSDIKDQLAGYKEAKSEKITDEYMKRVSVSKDFAMNFTQTIALPDGVNADDIDTDSVKLDAGDASKYYEIQDVSVSDGNLVVNFGLKNYEGVKALGKDDAGNEMKSNDGNVLMGTQYVGNIDNILKATPANITISVNGIKVSDEKDSYKFDSTVAGAITSEYIRSGAACKEGTLEKDGKDITVTNYLILNENVATETASATIGEEKDMATDLAKEAKKEVKKDMLADTGANLAAYVATGVVSLSAIIALAIRLKK